MHNNSITAPVGVAVQWEIDSVKRNIRWYERPQSTGGEGKHAASAQRCSALVEPLYQEK